MSARRQPEGLNIACNSEYSLHTHAHYLRAAELLLSRFRRVEVGIRDRCVDLNVVQLNRVAASHPGESQAEWELYATHVAIVGEIHLSRHAADGVRP